MRPIFVAHRRRRRGAPPSTSPRAVDEPDTPEPPQPTPVPDAAETARVTDGAEGSFIGTAARLGAMGAAFLTGFALVKAYAVANFSLTTGSALLTTAPVSVLLGSLMSYAYWLFPLTAIALFWACRRAGRRGWSGGCTVLLAGGVLTALLSPVRPLLWCTGALLLYLAVFRLPGRLLRDHADGTSSRWTAVGLSLTRHAFFGPQLFFTVALLWLVIASLPRTWVPVEIMRIQDGLEQKFIVGNVISGDGEWTTVLRAGDRGLSRIRSEDVYTRRVCHLTGAQSPGQAPLMWVLIDRPYRSPNLNCQRLADDRPGLPVVEGSFPDSG
ncbi:hypothetical protein OF117_15355 [Geodermatophilus sp. YIM 151500]|uniref:hypothetical protein n=1 Tax=Geodermatophilus sp. YIM 151500 TaxID=2984531 RepID=UPI0021E4A7A7|nr:hypothetical protein [Geodermatophilus sp. YIM 151500]MCV2490736.1 hypothetical protein [Geodermatophilus sp. YIM 151500]